MWNAGCSVMAMAFRYYEGMCSYISVHKHTPDKPHWLRLVLCEDVSETKLFHVVKVDCS